MGVKTMFETPEVLNPFPGLRPFETEETNLFFGRDGQSDELLERLRRTRFLAVVGTSGSGKSSLIRAGLLPALYGGLMGSAGSNWRIAMLRPGHDPIGNLASALGEPGVLGADDQDSEIQNALIETTLRRSSIGVVEAAQQARMSAHENLLIVVDQFEELFRFKEARKETGSEDDAAAFVKLLLEASAQGAVPIYVVLTMRSDFLGDCAQFAGLPEAINQGQYLIPRMSRDERRAAITGPVAVGGGEITLPLVNRLLNDVGDNPDQLPILQHALMRTWDYRATHRRNSEPIGLEHYEAIGTMSEALSLHADEAFNELPNDRSQLIAETLFKALSERGADNREIRRPTRLSAICDIADASMPEVIAVIDVFRGGGRSFLMPPAGVELQPDTVIDISHESLIRNWLRLKDWVNEEAQSARIYRRLAEAAVLHREGSEGLLQDPALQIARDWHQHAKPTQAWAERYHREFAASLAYLEESRAARDAALAERERQRQLEIERDRRELEQAQLYAAAQARAAQRLRRFTFALVLISLLAIGAAGGAVYGLTVARRNQKLAEASEKRTRILAGDLDASQRNVEAAKLAVAELDELAETAQTLAEDKGKKALAEEKNAAGAKADAERATLIAGAAKRQAAIAAEEITRDRIALSTAEVNEQLNRDAFGAFQRGNMSEAETAFEGLVTTYVTDPDPSRLAWARSHLGEARRQLGKFDESIKDLEEAQKIQQKTIVDNRVRTKDDAERDAAAYLDTITWLARAHSDKGEYDLAEPLYLEAVKIRRSASNLEQLARNYVNLARTIDQLGAAEKTYNEALALRRANRYSPDLTALLKEVAEFELVHGDSATAIKLYEEALSNQEILAPNDPNLAVTFNELARAYEGGTERDKKEAHRLNALARQIRLTGVHGDPGALASNMDTLADRYIDDGRVSWASVLRVRAHEMFARLEGPDSPVTMDHVIDLGDFWRYTTKLWPTEGQQRKSYAAAESCYQQALEASQRKGFIDLEVHALEGLAGLRLEQKDFAEAEGLYKRALDIGEQKRDVAPFPELPMIEDLHGLAQSAIGQGKNAEAETYLLRAVMVFDEVSESARRCYKPGTVCDGRTVTVTAGILNAYMLRHVMSARLAELYRSQGRLKEADEQYRPLAAKLKAMAPSSLRFEHDAQGYLEIVEKAGQFYTERGDIITAESFYRLIVPEELWPSTKVLVRWPEDAYAQSLMGQAPDSCVKQMIRILDSYTDLLKKAGRERETESIRIGIRHLRDRVEE
jgi:hypothetical protein